MKLSFNQKIQSYSDLHRHITFLQTQLNQWESYNPEMAKQFEQQVRLLEAYEKTKHFSEMPQDRKIVISYGIKAIAECFKDISQSKNNFLERREEFKRCLQLFKKDLTKYLNHNHIVYLVGLVCDQIILKKELYLDEFQDMKDVIDLLVQQSMTPEFLQIDRVEEFSNFIDRLNQIWSDKIHNPINYKDHHKLLKRPAEAFQSFLDNDQAFKRVG